MKKTGMSIGASIAIGIGAIFFIIIEWVALFLVSAYLTVETVKDLYEDYKDEVNIDDEYEGYLSFEDSSINVKFRYPDNFTKKDEDTSNGYKTIAFYDEITGEGVNLVVGDISKEATFSEYIDASIASLKQSFSLTDENIEIEKDNIKLGGIQGFKNYYVSNKVNVYQCATLIGKTEYVLTYSGLDTEFNKETGDKIFRSFEFLSSESKNQNKKETNKAATKESAVEIGKWVSTSKYIPSTNKYQDVKVKVNSIIRGEDAKKVVEEYANKSSSFEYKNPDENTEWVVVDYDVDMDGVDIPSYGISPTLNITVVGTGKYDSVTYNGKAYSTFTYSVSSNDYVKEKNVNNKVAFLLPVGCEDYLIKFGNYDQTICYIKGK